MDLVEQVHIFGLSNFHTFEPNIRQIRLFSLIVKYTNNCIQNIIIQNVKIYRHGPSWLSSN